MTRKQNGEIEFYIALQTGKNKITAHFSKKSKDSIVLITDIEIVGTA